MSGQVAEGATFAAVIAGFVGIAAKLGDSIPGKESGLALVAINGEAVAVMAVGARGEGAA